MEPIEELLRRGGCAFKIGSEGGEVTASHEAAPFAGKDHGADRLVRAGIHFAFTTLGCAIICLNQLTRFC